MSARHFLSVRLRCLTAFTLTVGALAVTPAVSQATVTNPGIAVAGTAIGQWVPGSAFTGPASIQFSGVEYCNNAPSTFVATWTDGFGAHRLRMDPAAQYASLCGAFDSSGAPQFLAFNTFGLPTFAVSDASLDGSADNSYVEGSYDGPLSSFDPFTVVFVLGVPYGVLSLQFPQTPGPLQGAPGRVQPFSLP